MLRKAVDDFSALPRGTQRTILATLLLFDAAILGLLNGQGILNQIDKIVAGGLPNDLVWLLQLVEAISAGFAFIKILFDLFSVGLDAFYHCYPTISTGIF